MRGRPPTPTALKILRGNPGKRALNRNEPTPAPRRSLAPPSWLAGELARREWRRLAPKLSRLGLLSEIDDAALGQYCQLWQRWREAEAALREHGMVIVGNKGAPVLSPYVAIVNRSLAQMRALLVEFGMTPASRSRVKTDPGAKAETDPFEKFDHAPTLAPWRP